MSFDSTGTDDINVCVVGRPRKCLKCSDITALRRGEYKGKGRSLPMSQKKTIFVTVLGGVAEVDTTTVPEGVEVEIVDFDELDEPETDYLKLLSAKVRAYVKGRRAVDF